jgi:hypothetical protein
MKSQSITKINLKKIHDVACPTWKSKIEEFAKRDLFNDKIELTQSEVDEMFDASDDKQKSSLNKFLNKSKNLLAEINSFEDACNVLGIIDSENEIKILKSLSTPNKFKMIAFYKLEIIIRALNNGWYPNWTNSNEYKYWNYFSYYGGGGFSFYNTSCNATRTHVPSALYFKTLELAKHGAKIAFEEYKEFYK